MNSRLKVGVIQHAQKSKDPLRELEVVQGKIKALGDQGVDLVCLPELWPTGPLKAGERALADVTPEILSRLQTLSEEYRIVILGGLPEKGDLMEEEGTLYNSAFFIGPQKKRLVYRKIHLFGPLGEKEVFRPGSEEIVFWHGFSCGEVGVGPLICYDLRFPELSRSLVLEGAEVLVVMALWPRERVHHFEALLRARAIENQCFVIGVNTAGDVGGMEFGGRSKVVGPDGAVLREAGQGPEVIVSEIDLSSVVDVRRRFFTAGPERWQRRTARKVLDMKDLVDAVRRRRAAGQRCVFTNGCFDILHAGHVSYLEEARRCGDFLVVGINSDKSVRSIKGDARPINPGSMRALVVAGLESVDYVVFFDEPTPIEVIRAISPDCLVKGEDWDEDNIVGAGFVKERGGIIKRIPFAHDISTTKIIRRILKKVTIKSHT